jgi:hypothetical protein
MPPAPRSFVSCRAQRSGRRSWVISVRASARRQLRHLGVVAREQHRRDGAALPFGRPRVVRVLKKPVGARGFPPPRSSAAPITPGSSRTQASSSSKRRRPRRRSARMSPIETSSRPRASITRSSMPSKRPQSSTQPGPAASVPHGGLVQQAPARRQVDQAVAGIRRPPHDAGDRRVHHVRAHHHALPRHPKGVSSTLRWRSVAKPRMSSASTRPAPFAASALARRATGRAARETSQGTASGRKRASSCRVLLVRLRPYHQLPRRHDHRDAPGRHIHHRHHRARERHQAFAARHRRSPGRRRRRDPPPLRTVPSPGVSPDSGDGPRGRSRSHQAGSPRHRPAVAGGRARRYSFVPVRRCGGVAVRRRRPPRPMAAAQHRHAEALRVPFSHPSAAHSRRCAAGVLREGAQAHQAAHPMRPARSRPAMRRGRPATAARGAPPSMLSTRFTGMIRQDGLFRPPPRRAALLRLLLRRGLLRLLVEHRHRRQASLAEELRHAVGRHRALADFQWVMRSAFRRTRSAMVGSAASDCRSPPPR